LSDFVGRIFGTLMISFAQVLQERVRVVLSVCMLKLWCLILKMPIIIIFHFGLCCMDTTTLIRTRHADTWQIL